MKMCGFFLPNLDSVGLIHMNGRVYDPELGRFMSADPFVQAPYNSQSYNRYSYVFNNPLSFTDPSGYTTDCNNQNAGIGHAPGGDCVEEVQVTCDSTCMEQYREQQQAQQNAINASNLSYWQSWSSQREIMINATAGLYIGLASINGGTYVWNDHEISLTDRSEGSVMTLDDAAALGGGTDQLVGLTGMYLSKTIKKGQLSIIRENNWKGFSYQSGLRKSLQYLNFGSKFLFGVGTVISAKQGVNAAGAGDNFSVFKSLLDVVMWASLEG
jgi:RHS repeat-associated protein